MLQSTIELLDVLVGRKNAGENVQSIARTMGCSATTLTHAFGLLKHLGEPIVDSRKLRRATPERTHHH